MSPWLRRAVLLPVSLFFALPFALVALMAVMPPAALARFPGELAPFSPTLRHLRAVLGDPALSGYVWNSLLVSGATTLGNLAVSALGGYAFARFDFPFKRPAWGAVVATLAIPPIATVVPLFSLFASAGALDTRLALVLPGLASALGVVLMRQAFEAQGAGLEEAAAIDGASRPQAFLRVALPLAAPTIAALAALVFLTTWNAFLWPLVATHSEASRTLAVGLASYRSSFREVTDWGRVMAATLVALLPGLLALGAAQKAFVRGLGAGAEKG